MTDRSDLNFRGRLARAGASVLLLALGALVCGCASPGRQGGGFDAGFIASQDVDLSGNARLRAAGPFFERRENAAGMTFTAVRPFYCRVDDPVNHCTLNEFAWPLGMHKDAYGDVFWRILLGYGHDFDSRAPDSRYRFSIFPFLFAGRDANGEKYFALFPLGGTIHEFLMMDRVAFALFPLYGQSTTNGKQSRTVLWPIAGWTKGEGVDKFRILPFYSRYTNEGRFTKRAIMWPIWTSVRYEYPDYHGGGYLLFPIMGHVETQDQETWMLLPPFFRWSNNDTGHCTINCPWPFLQYSRGDIDKLYIWPLWGHKHVGQLQSSFVLWPIVGWQREIIGDQLRKRFNLVPFVYAESRRTGALDTDVTVAAADRDEPGATPADAAGPLEEVSGAPSNTPDQVTERYFKLWPLFSYQREDDVSLFRTLALWPLKNTPSVERNWAPLWSLYRRERSGAGVENELLWGLFRKKCDGSGTRSLSVFPLLQSSRCDAGTGSRKWSLLYGLVGYEREGLRKQLRLLYLLKMGGRRQASEEDSDLPLEKESNSH